MAESEWSSVTVAPCSMCGIVLTEAVNCPNFGDPGCPCIGRGYKDDKERKFFEAHRGT